LIKRYTLSAEKRVKEVLDNIQLPGELPSIFFRRMIATADEHLPYDIVLQRFRERLPGHIAEAITPITAQINKKYQADKTRPVQEELTMLEVADLIPNSTVSPTFNSAINHSPHRRSTSRHNRSTSRSRIRSRSPSNKRFHDNGSWCRNHFLYRDQALVVPSASTQFPQSTSNIDATTISTVTSKRLFVQDQNSKLLFLIDTGSDISIVSARKQNLKEDDQCLFAANGSRIKSYGKRYFNLNLGLRRAFNYKFTIADTQNNIIGADFWLTLRRSFVDVLSKKSVTTIGIYHKQQLGRKSSRIIANSGSKQRK
ncbi:hypothetical protein BLOT_011343, partial [Blomia tropicalis]